MFEGFEAYQESDCAGRKSCGLGVRAVLRPSGGQGDGHPAEFPTVARIRSRSRAGFRESLSAEWDGCFLWNRDCTGDAERKNEKGGVSARG